MWKRTWPNLVRVWRTISLQIPTGMVQISVARYVIFLMSERKYWSTGSNIFLVSSMGNLQQYISIFLVTF
jgi:hypothetical protein